MTRPICFAARLASLSVSFLKLFDLIHLACRFWQSRRESMSEQILHTFTAVTLYLSVIDAFLCTSFVILREETKPWHPSYCKSWDFHFQLFNLVLVKIEMSMKCMGTTSNCRRVKRYFPFGLVALCFVIGIIRKSMFEQMITISRSIPCI